MSTRTMSMPMPKTMCTRTWMLQLQLRVPISGSGSSESHSVSPSLGVLPSCSPVQHRQPPRETHSRQGAWAFMHMRFQVPFYSRLSAFFLSLFFFFSFHFHFSFAPLRRRVSATQANSDHFRFYRRKDLSMF